MAKIAVFVALVALCATASARTLKQEPASIADLVASNPDFSTLLAAVQTAGLADALSSSFEGTVFAPTNAAFEKLLTALGATPEELLANPALTQILLHHVSSAKVLSADATVGAMIPTLEGSDLTVETITPSVTIMSSGGSVATVTMADIMVGDAAVVHVIDTVLIPAIAAAPAPAPMEEMEMEA